MILLDVLKLFFFILIVPFGFVLFLWFVSFVFNEICRNIEYCIERHRRLYPNKVDKANKKINLTKDKNERKNGGDR